MWKVVSTQPRQSSYLFVTISSMAVLLFFVATLPTSSYCLPLGNADGSSSSSSSSSSPSSSADLNTGVDFAQLQSLFREAIKYIHNHKVNSNLNNNMSNRGGGSISGGGGGGGGSVGEPTRISGQVNLRYPRSEIGDVALRLWSLQEMDRKYGAKARPRFGKRNEVTQDNFIPMYGDEEQKDLAIGVNGDGLPLAAPQFIFIP